MKKPPLSIVIEAFLFLPVAIAIMVLCMMLHDSPKDLPNAILIALLFFIAIFLHVLFLAAPLYYWVHQKGWANWMSATVSGFLIGAVPSAISSWPLHGEVTNASVRGYGDLAIDGVVTMGGWRYYVDQLIGVGLYGAMFGLIFWLYLTIRFRLYLRSRRNRI